MAMEMKAIEKSETERFLRAGEAISPVFFAEMETRLSLPFAVTSVENGERLEVQIKLPNEVLSIKVNRKRLVSNTTYLFVMWMVGSAVILTGVALIFLRNQIRPIARLSAAMESFGKGVDAPGYRPQGAREVRRAGRAFLQMKQRIERQISARMDMLAGISHDLRTPLTRMKLQTQMLEKKQPEAADNLRRDVGDMEHMIEEYLDFVRGEGMEAPKRLSLATAVEEIVQRYVEDADRIKVDINGLAHVEVDIRPNAFRRALTNIINNALRYGECARVRLQKKAQAIYVYVEDDGPGIPQAKREEVFRPFRRLDESRNVETGGVGLGLTIARDIIHAHGGDIQLSDAGSGGLSVAIRLPRPS